MIAIETVQCAATIILWGINPILTRIVSQMVGIRPYMITTSILSTTGIVVLNSVMHLNLWSDVWDKMVMSDSPDLWKVWLLTFTDALLCLAVPSILYNILLANTKSVAIVVTTTWYGAPLLTSVLGTFTLGQHLSKMQIWGIFVSLAGICLMNAEDIVRDMRNTEALPSA
jgi:drug/metabolite transporter (DMT)-like permease